MAATNYDYSGFFEQRPQIAAQYHFGSCKVEAAHGNHYTSSSQKEQQNNQKIHISNNAYYGHHPAKPHGAGPHDVDDTRLMDCDMAPISSFCTPERTLGRKRASDDVSYASFKRFRQEELAPPPQAPMVPYQAPQSFARPTHCNPDVTRCLMAHMI